MAARPTRSSTRGPSRRRPAASSGWRVRSGWIASLLGAVLLVCGGFASGLMIGVVVEEPELLLGHLAGRAESVPWSLDDAAPESAPAGEPAPAEAPQVAAAPPAPRPPAARATPPPAPRQATPDVAAPPPAGERFSIQVGAFSSDATARKMAADLGAKGYPTYVRDPAGDADRRWRVRVGPLATRAEADRLAARLQSRDGLPTWVLSEEGS